MGTMDTTDTLDTMGALDVRLVTFIHDKLFGKRTFASFADVVCAFYDELDAKLEGQVSQFPLPMGSRAVGDSTRQQG